VFFPAKSATFSEEESFRWTCRDVEVPDKHYQFPCRLDDDGFVLAIGSVLEGGRCGLRFLEFDPDVETSRVVAGVHRDGLPPSAASKSK